MATLAHNIDTAFDAFGGTIPETELLMKMPALDPLLLSVIIKHFLPHVLKMETNGLICFSHIESLGLPDDFSATLSEAVLKLESLSLRVSETSLHTALSLAYGVNFNYVYQILDRKTFRNIVTQYFKGETQHVWTQGVFSEVRC
jgi:hypothetical protein